MALVYGDDASGPYFRVPEPQVIVDPPGAFLPPSGPGGGFVPGPPPVGRAPYVPPLYSTQPFPADQLPVLPPRPPATVLPPFPGVQLGPPRPRIAARSYYGNGQMPAVGGGGAMLDDPFAGYQPFKSPAASFGRRRNFIM